jgi:hypothetical protein
MRWITALDLENWAKTLGARDDLPKIGSDLIRASAPDIASIRFPSGDKGQVRGFDGHLVSDVAALNVPLGRSFWEFGTNVDYQSKAKGDFEKRTKEVAEDVQKETTYVFVTPRTWDSSNNTNKIEDFVSQRKKESSWRDIRFIDGAALETWLEHHPAVSAWHARNTLRLYPIDGLRSTDEFWSEFGGQFGPPLTEEVVLCERDQAVGRLLQDLSQPSNAVTLVADSPDEALAFAIAAIRKASPEVRLFLEARTLVVDSSGAGRQLLPHGRLVLLLRNDAAKSPTQFSQVGTTFVSLGRQQRGVSAPTLIRPTAHAMGLAMRSMGLEENRALTLARGSGRSLAALARLIPSGSYDPPAWEHKAQELLPAILAGAWDSSNSKDREIVEQLADGSNCSQVEGRVRAHLQDTDPPFDLEGSIWKVRAPMDAFIRVGPLIGSAEAGRLRAAMLQVFAEIEPEPDPDEVVSLPRSKPRVYSDWLRDGLATTLLLLAIWSEVARVNLGAETGQLFANRTLQELPGLKSDPRLLTSLRDELPLLAEAAPDPLLSALEHMLEGDGAAISPIFKERPGLLHPTSEHTGVLWALETLAWDPEYFHRAVLVLARLAAIDPGGKLANRPAHSLAEIFVLWNPNTNASSAQRSTALDEIARTCPEVGWKLILQLLPTTHGTSSPTAKPKLREAGAADRKPITYAELWSNQAIVCTRAITLAGTDPGRWLELVARIASFPPPERDRAALALDEMLQLLNGAQRKVLWAKVRDEVSRHERFKTAGWALSDEELVPFKRLVEKYAPADPVTALATLFDNWALDEAGDMTKGNQRRANALQKLYSEAGPEAVIRLAAEARVPYLVVEAADAAGFSDPQVAELLALSFEKQRDSSFTLSLSGLYRKMAGEAQASLWLRRLLEEGKATPQLLGALFQAWPDGRETWQVVRRFGQEVVDAYWTQRSPRYLRGSRSDLLRSTLMLLRYGRAIEAIQSSLDRLPEIPTKLLVRMLDGVIPEINARAVAPDTMTSFYIEKALEALDRRNEVTEMDIATREYKFYPLLEYSGRKLHIFQVMAQDPALFHQILRNVYLAKGEEKGDGEVGPEVKANASLSYRLLSNFNLLPGQKADIVDGAALSAWIDEFRRLGAETDRTEITDSYVGRVLAHAPPDPDGAWPHRVVRSEIERLGSDDVERALQIERYNMRGVHSRGVYEGGDQERALAKTAFDAADASAAWPKTAALLRRIGQVWQDEAKRADLDAAQRRLRS